MTADKSVANAYTTDAIFLGDDALDIVYYIEVDGVKKDIETSAGVTVGKDTYLSYTRDKFTGRMVCIPGTFPGKSWDAASNIMTYMGEGLYSYTFKNVPAANYEYKITMGDWSENYGAGGVISGSNIAVTVTEPQDVTIYYSDFSHYSKCSIDYKFGASLLLQGTGILADTRFSDSRLTGIYSATVANMEAGTYSDTKIVSEDETVEMDPYTVDTTKDVTFYYDPESGIYYSNASDKEVATNKLVFDSKDTAYKSVYGAVATGEEVTYSIDTGDDVTAVKLVVKGVEKKTLSMKKTAGAEDGKQRWSVTTSYDRLGEYQYFFAVYNETAVVMYGDDDGYYGTGMATDLLSLLPYDQIVYQSGYKTPDWMKNAVIYQIFPDRFYNGDVTNDTITSDARGTVQYEYMNDWYILPENPEQITLHPDTYPTYAYKGDGNWSNEIYGGDLKGITKRIDYLKALGVTVIYLNPVFESISSHRYDTSDYKNIDPILGTLGDFEELVSVAEANNMHVVLDGVFNHVSDDSVYFDRYYEYLEDGTDTIGAYPYWAYVYDAMSEKKISKEEAEKQAKEYFTAEYGITNYDYTLKATVTPKDCTDKSVKWKSSKSSVVKVDANGKVTAKKAGTATITAATKNGLKATCKITVTDPATKVYLTPAMSIKKGSSVKLTASVFPKTTTDKLTWSTSNKKVVTVTKSGKIKGVKTGTATITVKTTSGKKATCKVTVVKSNKKSAGIKLSAKKLTLKQNATKQLKATLDKNATDKVTWSSSNKKVATVDKNGVVTAVKKGTVTITAKTSGGKKATCKVTVKVPATKVKLNKTKATVAKGRTLTLKATMTPSSSTDKLTWTSSNKKVASVDKNGKVKALKKGTATITVKTTSGKKATCKITVK